MKRIALVVLVSLIGMGAAQAAGKIGLVDMRNALFSSKAAKQFTEDTVSQFKQQDLEVRAVGEEGQKLDLRLKNDAAIMSDSERAKTAADLEEKIQEYKYLKTKLDKALAEKRQQFLEESRPRLDNAINQLVQKEKLDLLLPREAALYAAEGMDYTAQIIDMLDAQK
jgi:outer membrane protein